MTLVLSAIYVCGVVAVILFAFFHFPPTDGMYKDFRDAATVGVGAVSAVMTAIVTLVVAQRSTRAARDLEETRAKLLERLEQSKLDLAKQLADHNHSLQKDLQHLKVVSDHDLEKLKATIGRELDAYQQLLSAALFYYSSLSKLATATWTPSDHVAAEDRMTAARSSLAYVVEQHHRDLWERLWNRANFIADSAEALVTKAEQPQLWLDQVQMLGGLAQDFQNVVARQFPRPSSGI